MVPFVRHAWQNQLANYVLRSRTDVRRIASLFTITSYQFKFCAQDSARVARIAFLIIRSSTSPKSLICKDQYVGTVRKLYFEIACILRQYFYNGYGNHQGVCARAGQKL